VSADDIAHAYQHLNNCDPYKDIIVAEVSVEKSSGMRVVGGSPIGDPGRIYHHNGFLVPEWRRKGIGKTMLSLDGKPPF
jgi:GNAT superfamily N-acetyltransferase